MICHRCKTDIPDESKYCCECGERQNSFCRQCGAEIGAYMIACPECGLAISPQDNRDGGKALSVAPGEKKHVTVLFSDLSGYTSLTESLDPEEVKEIMGSIFAEVTNVVEKYEGFIEKYVGDAVMVLFGAVKAHEDDPVRAIKAAFEIHDAVRSLKTVWKEKTGRPLVMHSSINTGSVVIEGVNRQRGEHGALGDTINVASRMLKAAKADQIIIGAETRRQAEGFFLFEQTSPLIIKGKDEPVDAYLVSSHRDEPQKVHRLSGVRSRLIGRDLEMSILHEALSNLKQGQGSIVSIVGDAGTGKSRLIEEFKSTLEQDAIRWREGHAYPYAQGTPYFLLTDLFRKAVDVKEGDSSDQLKQKLESRMRELIPDRIDLIPYVGSMFSLSYPEIEQVSPEYWKARLREAILLLLERLSQTGPTIVCLEDLHWADPSTVEIIRQILKSLHAPVFFICAYRPSFALFPEGEKKGIVTRMEMRLRDLSSSDAMLMLQSLLQSDSIPGDLEVFVHEKAEGNPFYLEELVNSLFETGLLKKEGGRWMIDIIPGREILPSTVQGVIQARVDRLDPAGKRILQEASVIGREFALDVLKRTTSLEGEAGPVIEDLERLDFIRSRPAQEERGYVFKHALTQEVVYNGLLKKERLSIHEKTGRAMEDLLRESLPVYYESLAYHFKNGHSIYKSIKYLRMAGEKHLRRYALNEAQQYYSEAFELLFSKPDRSRDDDLVLLDILLDWVVVYYHNADYRRMHELLNRHRNFAESLGNEMRLGMFYVRFGSALSRMERCREAYDYLHRALAIGESTGNRKIIGYACTWLIINCADLGLLDEAIAVGERVQAMDIYNTDIYVFRLSTASIGYANYFKGYAARVNDAGNKLLDNALKYDDMGSVVLGHTCLGISHVVMGDYPSAIECFRRSIQAALEPIYAYTTKIMLGITYVSNGQFAEAESVLNEITAFNEQHSYGFVGNLAMGLMGVVMITKGELRKGIEIVNDVIASCVKHESWWRYASLNLLLGKFYLQMAHGGAKKDLSFIWKNIGFLLKTVPFARRKAENHLNIALKTAEDIGAKGIEGQVSLELGRLGILKGANKQAEKLIRKAVALFEECGATVHLKNARELLEKIASRTVKG